MYKPMFILWHLLIYVLFCFCIIRVIIWCILLGLPFHVYIISYLLFHSILCILLIYPAM